MKRSWAAKCICLSPLHTSVCHREVHSRDISAKRIVDIIPIHQKWNLSRQWDMIELFNCLNNWSAVASIAGCFPSACLQHVWYCARVCVCVCMCVWLSDQQAPCRSALKDWLQIHGKQIYYDRLSRALQKIGRTDIAIGQSHTTTLTHMQCTTSLKPTCNLYNME